MRSLTHTTIMAVLTASVLACGAASAEDRYGPARAHEPADAAPVSLLSWPGKAAPATVAKPAPPANAAALPTSLYAPIPPSSPPRYQAAYRPAQPAAPALAASPAQPRLAGGQGDAPRFYSLHRQFGLQPDPIALSPQFLADSGGADLAEPPPLPPPHVNPAQTANMNSAAAASQARAAQSAAQSDAVN